VVNVPFNIYDRNNSDLFPMVGYSLPFEQFKFVANFATTGNFISDKKVVWNFGDRTSSTELTAFHYYKYPGVYPVTLTVFNSSGDGTLSTVTSAVYVSNYINDSIQLTTDERPIIISGSVNIPIFLTRYNSWQTTLSGLNTVINLSVSGNKLPYFTPEKYYTDKDVQFKSSARFIIDTELGLTVVGEVSTTNDIIYASPAGSGIVLSLSGGTCVAGSSGGAMFFYTEDFKIQ